MPTTPAVTPVTVPVPGLTVATEGLLLDQVPPLVPSLTKITDPEQTIEGPVIGAGKGFIDIVTEPMLKEQKVPELVAITE